MDYLKFPKSTYFLTQAFGKGTYSHIYRKAIDVSAAGRGSKKIFAPFSGTIKKKFVSNPRIAYTCWLVSDNKVICADGMQKYAVMMMTHPNGIANVKVGQHFNQGDYMFDDGTTGGVAAHLDIEVAVYDNKKDMRIDWYRVQDGSYALYNSVDPFKVLVMDDNCKVLNDVYQGKKYPLKCVKEVIVHPTKDYFIPGATYKLLYSKCLRATPNLGNNIVKAQNVDTGTKQLLVNQTGNAMFKVGTEITSLHISTETNGRIWGSYGNCWYCLQNVDGTKNATKI